jgi:inositol 1,4,5-triphosphate receptor type 1/inositol 1,4,5-triphosphate receptor type 3
MNLILKEGRQLRFLKILQTLMIYEKSYIFDNQILIQNSLIPPDLGESNIKILYCDGARSFELKMCFDDQM